MKHYLLTDFINLPLESAVLTSFFTFVFDCRVLLWHPFTSMTALLSAYFQGSWLMTRWIWRRAPWLTFGGTEGCCVIFRYCLALLMDRLLSWTATGACWPTCSFTSQMASSTCPGTTPASWWRTAARATPTPTTIPHHRVGPVPILLLQLCTCSWRQPRCQGDVMPSKTSRVSGSCEAEGWYGRVALFPALPPALLQVMPHLCCSTSVCTNEITSQSLISFQWGWVKNSRHGYVRFHW